MALSNKKLDGTGLAQVWSLIVAAFVAKEDGKGLSSNDFTNTYKQQLEQLVQTGREVNVIESIKVNGVALEVTDKGVNITVPTGTLASLDKVSESNLDTALAALINGKADKATTLAGYGITDAYTITETENAIKQAVSGTYRVKGTVTFANLPTVGMQDGDVYNVSDAFTTTALFKEGAGKEYPEGTNVVYVAADTKWDCMAGTYDFSAYMKKTDLEDLTEAEISEICQIKK